MFDKNARISAFVVVVNDLTNLREAEVHREQAKSATEDLNAILPRRHEELEEKAQQLEQANVEMARLGRAKSEFVGAVSQR